VARRDSEQYFRTLVQSMSDVILIVDDDGKVSYASPSAPTIFGDEPLVGRALPTGGHSTEEGFWTIERPDGTPLEVEVAFRDLRQEPTVRGVVVTLRDVTQRQRLERELTYLAFHDSLTGLPNRVRFGELVERAVDTGGVVGVLFVDVDDFKVINDTMGHDVGDQLLEEVGRRLSTVVTGHDVPARLGGDEFAVLVQDADSSSEVEAVADRVVAALSEPVLLGGSLLNASASIGVATTADARTKGDLLRHADLALYVAKGSGKARWRRFQSTLHAAMVKRLELRAALDRAVAQGDFSLAYQPIVALADGQPVGFEALLRWDDPERGLVLPGEFIEVAEDSGLIVPIGEWALHQAMVDACGWKTVDGPAPYLSINVSVRQFRSAGLIDTIEHALQASRLPPDRLLLEITESLLLRDDERVANDLAHLREMGIRLAIDDFGTGYSSLSYLRHVPVNILKIDKSFIDAMHTSTQQRALVDTIIRLARTLGLGVVAEGVQRPDDRDMLVAMGCPYGQGFLFSAALPNNDALDWLRNHHLANAAP
jgi:diguanylate cyclase (GGDEF)-like protein